MLISYMYVCTCEICIWIYVPTCRNKCNWCTLKHLVLVRIKGLKKSPKIPGNTFSDTLLKSRFRNLRLTPPKKNELPAVFFGGSHAKKWCAPSIIVWKERWFSVWFLWVALPSVDDLFCALCWIRTYVEYVQTTVGLWRLSNVAGLVVSRVLKSISSIKWKSSWMK